MIFVTRLNGSEIVVKTLNDLDAPKFADGETTTLTWHVDDCFAFNPGKPA